jgi:hypothetical protein
MSNKKGGQLEHLGDTQWVSKIQKGDLIPGDELPSTESGS